MLSLFSNTRMTTTRPVRTAVQSGPLYWVAGENEGTGARIAKFAVYNSTSTGDQPTPYANGIIPVQMAFEGVAQGGRANLTVLTAPSWDAFNEAGKSDVVQSTVTTITAGSGGVFGFELPDLSVALLETRRGEESRRGQQQQAQQQQRGGARGKLVWESEDGALFTME